MKVIEALKVRSQDSRFPRVCVFPEATTSNGAQLMQFKKGAFASGEPVTPLLLTYPAAHYNSAHTGQNGTNMSLIRCFFQFHNRMKVVILDAYVPDEEEKADADLYASNVRTHMAKELGIPTVEHTLPDFFLMREGQDADFYYECDFVVAELTVRWGLDLDKCKVLLSMFMEIDKKKAGALSQEDFVDLFRLQTAEKEYISNFFSFFDDDDTGAISMREYIQAVAAVSASATLTERAALAFAACDKSARGGLSVEDLRRAGEEFATLGTVLATSKGGADAGSSLVDAKMFAKHDKDGDGLLNYEEFMAFAKDGDNAKVLAAPVGIIRELLGVCFENLNEGTEVMDENVITV